MTDTSNPLIAALAPLTSRVRTDVTWTRNAAGEQRLKHHQALTPARTAAHLNGGPARGVCPVQAGESVTLVGTIDLDAHDGESETPWAVMAARAGAVVSALDIGWGATAVAFRSTGGHGVHLHVIWDAPQDIYSVRTWLRAVLACAGLVDGVGGVAQGRAEVFPKQDFVAPGKYGNQFILPLAGKSEWLVLDEDTGVLVPAPRALTAADWATSPPVPVAKKPAAPVRAAGASSWALDAPWRGALEALAGQPDHFTDRAPWRDVLFALHFESEGDEAGRDLAHEWSARLPKYAAEEVDKLWGGATVRADGITGATIMHMARELAGWSPLIDASDYGPVDDPDALRLVVQDASGGGTGAVAAGDDGEGDGAPFEVEGTPTYTRDRQNVIKPTVENTVAACSVSREIGFRLAWDEFRDEITTAAPGTNDWRPLTDADVVEIRIALERLGFKTAGREQVRDAVVLVAARNRYDSAGLWLKRVTRQWDGVRRVDSFLVRCFGVADTPYARACSRYIWTALAGRVLAPGCQVDMVPIFEGAQGVRKSSAVAALSPALDFFVEVDLGENEETIVRKSRGTLVAEIAELSGLQTRQLEWVKKYVTRRTEKWVPKYKEFPSMFARRVVHFGTTNRDDVLADETGERRWLPMHVTMADVEQIERDREQLWAEGALMFAGRLGAETPGIDRGRRVAAGGSVGAAGVREPICWPGGGVAWEDAEALARTTRVHEAFAASDAWTDRIGAWLDGNAALDLVPDDGGAEAGAEGSGRPGKVGRRGDYPLSLSVVMSEALRIPDRDQDMRGQKRAAGVLRGYGFEKRVTRVGSRFVKMWHPARQD